MTYIIIPKDYISPLKMKTLPIHHPSPTIHHSPLRRAPAAPATRRAATSQAQSPAPENEAEGASRCPRCSEILEAERLVRPFQWWRAAMGKH